ncbi:MAG: chemotaxis protein CheW [Elusimicrobia bacterium]|nr:chemotaxis protein CheW [Candidatus Liberimonas magnetica]
MPQAKTNYRKLVAFYLADEEYGVTITQIQEVILKPAITFIPGMPDFIEGVINLRGKIIPAIDLRKRFKLQYKSDTDKTRIIVATTTDQTVGLVVDGVSEVINLPEDKIDPMPPTISSIDAEYLSGVGKMEKRLIILLNVEKLLSEIEKVAIEQLSKKEKVNTEQNETK